MYREGRLKDISLNDGKEYYLVIQTVMYRVSWVGGIVEIETEMARQWKWLLLLSAAILPLPPSPILSSGRCHWDRFRQNKSDLKNEAGLLTVSKEMIIELIPGGGVNKGEVPDPQEKIVVY